MLGSIRFAASTLTLALWLGAGPLFAQVPAAHDAPSASLPASPERARLAPDGVAAAAAVEQLEDRIESALRVPALRTGQWGVLVVSLDHNDTVYARAPDAELAPASNMKLFTSAAALYYLGPWYRYTTFLLARGPIADGVVDGDLIVYGTGDPTLGGAPSPVWEAFADSLAALGVHEVLGDIIGDASYFTGPGVGAGWRTSYITAAYAAPAAALSFNENVVTLEVRPAAEPGVAPQVSIVPGRAGIAIENEARTVAGSRSSIRVLRRAYDGPVVIAGDIGVRHEGVTQRVTLGDPAAYAAAALREVLEARGIRVLGDVRWIEDPALSPLSSRSTFAPAFDDGPPMRLIASVSSAPLIEILEVVNKQSHNLYAEMVLRTMGRVVLGEGTAEAGVLAVRYFLECELGGAAAALQMVDGSGLSPLNRVSAAAVVDLLAFMAESPMWDAFWQTLPEAGPRRDGLRRMVRTPADGNLRAKTGTIDRVSALSGYVRARNGERLAFSILSNDIPSTWRAKRVEDEIGELLARFDRPLALAAAGTGPPAAADGTREEPPERSASSLEEESRASEPVLAR